MRKFHSNKIKHLAVLIAIICAILFFQEHATAQPVNLTIAHADIDQLSIGDIDFQTFGSQHWFFTITVNGATRNVRMKAQLHIDLADGSYSGDAFDGNGLCSRPFSIPRTITNLDIGKNSDIKLEPGFKFNDVASEKIKNVALSTGKLPAGTYTFTIDLIDDAAAQCGGASLLSHSEAIVINIRNFSRLDLISPANENSIPNGFPLFQWIYDGDSVQVTVAEYSSRSHSSEEAISGVPMLRVSSGSTLLPLGTHTLQYPSSGSEVRPLELGKTYVWQVKGLSRGTGGSGATINSEIWQFTVGSTATGQSSQNDEGTMNALQLLAGLNAEALKGLLSGDFQMTGVVMLNGRPVSAAEILRILNDLAANPDKIIDIQLVNR